MSLKDQIRFSSAAVENEETGCKYWNSCLLIFHQFLTTTVNQDNPESLDRSYMTDGFLCKYLGDVGPKL